jgi:RNA polymerase sigma factor (sigma-70 family)
MPTTHANRLRPGLQRVLRFSEIADRTDGQLLTAFLQERSEEAFAALVHRHGAMVLGVCRRVIGDSHLADDAFQAVFLILARRANAVLPREQVGNWLYGVAYRTAMRARMVLTRQRSREKQVEAMPDKPAPPTKDVWPDLHQIIDQELARLPDKLRFPIVLCDLEGRPQRTVAKQLGIALSTLAARLTSARRLLATRLTDRGVAISGGVLAMVLGERASAVVVLPKLAASTARAAEVVASGMGVSGLSELVSSPAIQLCEGVMRMMMLSKLKVTILPTLVALVLTCGFGFGLVPTQASEDPTKPHLQKQQTAASQSPKVAEPIDDATFLRRLCLDLTGELPTRIEMVYFKSDIDPNKRGKIIDWMVAEDKVRDYLAKRFAKRLGIPVERVQISRVSDATVGRMYRVTVVEDSTQRIPNQLIADFDRDGWLDVVVKKREIGSVTLRRWATATAQDDIKGDVQNITNESYAEVFDLVRFKEDVVLFDEPQTNQQLSTEIVRVVIDIDSDKDFLGRVMQSARGTAPTALEQKYFAEDKDPKKREKLLDLLLADPTLARQLGDAWKKKMLDHVVVDLQSRIRQSVTVARIEDLVIPVQPNRFEKLVAELIAAKKTDEQVLESLTLAVFGRLPTPEEKRATLAVIGTAENKRAAWVGLANALAATEEGKKNTTPSKPPSPPGR